MIGIGLEVAVYTRVNPLVFLAPHRRDATNHKTINRRGIDATGVDQVACIAIGRSIPLPLYTPAVGAFQVPTQLHSSRHQDRSEEISATPKNS